jgi:hypothetical protein
MNERARPGRLSNGILGCTPGHPMIKEVVDAGIAASTLKRAGTYPDSSDEDDRITFSYSRQREKTEVRDQQGTVRLPRPRRSRRRERQAPSPVRTRLG